MYNLQDAYLDRHSTTTSLENAMNERVGILGDDRMYILSGLILLEMVIFTPQIMATLWKCLAQRITTKN